MSDESARSPALRGFGRGLLAIGFLLPGVVVGGRTGALTYFALGGSNRDSLAPALFALLAGVVGASVGGVAAGLTGQTIYRLPRMSAAGGIAALVANILLWAGVNAIASRGVDMLAVSDSDPASTAKPAAIPPDNPCARDPNTLDDRERRIWNSECR